MNHLLADDSHEISILIFIENLERYREMYCQFLSCLALSGLTKNVPLVVRAFSTLMVLIQQNINVSVKTACSTHNPLSNNYN